MDFHLKQWRDHHQQQQQHEQDQESEEQQPSPAKFPRLLLQLDEESPSSDHHHHHPALPLFAPAKINTSFSSYPDSKPPLPPAASRLPCRVGGHFSMSQWQELELQALIFRHMVAGAVVPPELLQLVKKSLLSSPAYYLNNYSYYQPSLLQAAAGYWGRSAMDPEPGRCRRTDGKKWRCSRDVVAGQKYCERHVHRGRNRSRKPVEFPVPASSAAGGPTHGRGGSGVVVGGGVGAQKSSVFGSSQQQQSCGAHFSLSGPTPSLDIFQLNQGSDCLVLVTQLYTLIRPSPPFLYGLGPTVTIFIMGILTASLGGIFTVIPLQKTHMGWWWWASEPKPESKFLFEPQNDEGKYNGRVLRRFFDDWPRSEDTNEGRVNLATSLSISTPVANSSLDFLKLSTGNGEDDLSRRNSNVWSGENQVATMGGPLAEALRSSTGSSPTSVFNQIPRSASDTSYVTA